MASKIAKFIIISLIVACLILPFALPAAADNGDTDVGASVTITEDVPVEIIIEPANAEVVFYPGNPQTVHFWAHAHYSNSPPSALPANLNWKSSNTNVATIIPDTGIATIKAMGTTTIRATYAGLTGYTTLTVAQDTIAPVITLTSPTDGQVLRSNSTTVEGTVDDSSAMVNISVNGGTPLSVSQTSGIFSQVVSLETGSNNILATAVDDNGNTGTSGTITVLVDSNRPGIVISAPVTGTVTNIPTATVTCTITGAVNSANLTLNGATQSITVTGGIFSQSIILAEGINTLTVTAYAAGYEGNSDRLGTSGVKKVILDTTPPVITITSPPKEIICSSDKWPVISGTVDDPDVSVVSIEFNAVQETVPVVNGRFGVGLTTPLQPGTNVAFVTATDKMGNVTNPVIVMVNYNSASLDITMTSPFNGMVTSSANQVVNGLIWHTAVNEATLLVNSVPYVIPVDPKNENSVNFTANASLHTGDNIIKVTASDNATPPTGTGTSGEISIIRDNTPPRITVGLSDPADSITITVTANEHLIEAPSVNINSTTGVSMTQTGVNKWSGTYGSTDSPISDGEYSITVLATDRAGNTTTRSASFCKDVILIDDSSTTPVQTGTTTVTFNTSININAAPVTVTQHMGNPSGNVESPQGDDMAAAAFVEIIVPPNIRDNLEELQIRVYYLPFELPAGMIESTLKLYLWDVFSGTWQPVPGSGVNTDQRFIYGTVDHLSTYGAFGELEEDDQGDNNGGGGGGARGVTSLAGIITPEGRLTEDVIAPSSDLKVHLRLSSGTYCTFAGREPVYWIYIKALEENETDWPLPEGSERISAVYEMEPEGAVFDPSAKCTFRYRDNELPTGADENNLKVMRWQPFRNRWEPLPSLVDPVKNIVTTDLSRFSIYAVILSPRPAEFELSQFEITPVEITIDEETTISIVVTNTGDLSGDYNVTLRLNYETVETKTVTLDGSESQKVSFNISQKSAGIYTIDLNGLSGEFTVMSPEEPVPETPADTEIPPEPEASPTTDTTPQPETPDITPQPEPQPTADTTSDTGIEFRWWIFAALIAIVVIMGTALLLVFRHQKS